MKSLLLLAALIVFSQTAYGISNKLIKVEGSSNSMEFRVNYPGRISNTCGFKFVTETSYGFEKARLLKNAFVVSKASYPGRKDLPINIENGDHGAAFFRLQTLDTYLVHIRLETVSGAPISEIADKMQEDLYLVSTPCL